MSKYTLLTLKALLSFLFLMSSTMPIMALFGKVPAPTRDLYTNDLAFSFIDILMKTRYINLINSCIFGISLVLLWMRREALAALLILPITVNIVAFHWALDGGPFTGGAVMGNVLALLNVYFLWKNIHHYAALFRPHTH